MFREKASLKFFDNIDKATGYSEQAGLSIEFSADGKRAIVGTDEQIDKFIYENGGKFTEDYIKWTYNSEKEALGEEEPIAEIRSKSPVEHGIDLECMVCHKRFNELISGTCEACFRKWALTVRRR